MGQMRRVVALVAAVAVMVWLAGCSSSVGNGGSGLVITPLSATVKAGQSVVFSANDAVTWLVEETDGGTITASGQYTAPVTLGTYHVVAISLTEMGKTARATVYVTSGGEVPVTGLTAAPLADAASLGYSDGANLVRWPSMGSRVMAYLLYRDTNLNAPLAVVEGSMTYYLDSATPLPGVGNVMESTEVDISIDANTGLVEEFTQVPTYDTTLTDQYNGELQQQDQTLHVVCRRVPPAAGESCGYAIRVLYIDYDPGSLTDPLQHPAEYRLFLGNRSNNTPRITLTAPPRLTSPANAALPTTGVFRSTSAKGALNYVLQVSSDANFLPSKTVTVNGVPVGTTSAEAYYPFSTLWNTFQSSSGKPLYWRMGARVDGQASPAALMDTNQVGRVYALPNYFILPETPPVP